MASHPLGRRRALRAAAGAALTLLLAACNGVPAAAPVFEGPADRAVHVVSNGWHTGIVIQRSAFAPGEAPEAADLPGAFLEFGWGDRDYYPAPDPSLRMALAAALTPTPAVLHVAGHAAPPAPAPGIEVVRLPVTAAGERTLARRLDAAFRRGDSARAAPVAPGLKPGALFYPAEGHFHLFNTCNTWVARKLAAAGVAVSPSGVVTAGDLMARLRAAPQAAERRSSP